MRVDAFQRKGVMENTNQVTSGRIRKIRKEDREYPGRMRLLGGMPDELYVIGSLPEEDCTSVAIVGARLCSPYGHETAYIFGRELAKQGVQIVSGMATGIDGYAQEGALSQGGKSFAVLGCGVDVCYPASNRPLYEQLKKRGGILSEQPPGTEPRGYYFPSRNRIISALADIVVVVEAKARSGSLITVDFALQQGKTVYAVPGRVGDALSDGCNYLISQGAGIAYSPEAVLHELRTMEDTSAFAESCARRSKKRKKMASDVRSDAALSKEAKIVFRALSWDHAVSPDKLAESLPLPIPAIASSLMELVREGYADEISRGMFRRSRTAD